ncbi:hypothetical protein [Singulisphaera acidiphila]|uniref:Uncharacterized protein n=1 Tax=Singulisphaera acidiphila (strain ATCC BAA-1392 / DSM 18658 / VKM B-2454 / MOB10) TaxID=886293 RepID=L0DC29_SINAD|nr:hypothetical protein [Singulisphaera acidiphila]AGA26231.1 hypothetical protein Sinac_1867 [Singulisphaera acidiphila DSM 18658]
MRCTRCDRLAIPQAVGRTRDGLLVFGWCLDCLEEAGCTMIEAVSKCNTRRPVPRVLSLRPSTSHPVTPPSDRRRLLVGVASLLGAWSTVLIAVGVWTLRQPTPSNPSPLGNGRPVLFFVGGAATSATSLLLLCLSHGRGLLRSRQVCWWIQSGSFLLALAILVAGIVYHEPRRNPFIVVAAGLAIGLSLAAHWQERRLPAPPSRTGTMLQDWLQRH